jgi:hypothetical protein
MCPSATKWVGHAARMRATIRFSRALLRGVSIINWSRFAKTPYKIKHYICPNTTSHIRSVT